MQSEYIEIIEELPQNDFGLPSGNWFTDAGITPCGGAGCRRQKHSMSVGCWMIRSPVISRNWGSSGGSTAQRSAHGVSLFSIVRRIWERFYDKNANR